MKIRTIIASALAAVLVGGIGATVFAPVSADPLDDWFANPTFTCEEGTVPGWIGEEGIPTSCVDNHPCIATDTVDWNCNPIVVPVPAPEPAPIPVVEVPAPVVLAPAPKTGC